MKNILQAAARDAKGVPAVWQIKDADMSDPEFAIAEARQLVIDALGPKFKPRVVLVGIQGGKA